MNLYTAPSVHHANGVIHVARRRHLCSCLGRQRASSSHSYRRSSETGPEWTPLGEEGPGRGLAAAGRLVNISWVKKRRLKRERVQKGINRCSGADKSTGSPSGKMTTMASPVLTFPL